MYPEQPQPPAAPTPPPDYLNQIAPEPAKRLKFTLGPKSIAIIGSILVLLIVTVAITVNVMVQNGRQPLRHLSARLEATATVVDAAQDTLKSSQLRSLNSGLRLYLTDINRDIAAPLESAGIKIDNIDDKIISQESPTELMSRLEDARLNAIYDRTYAREMAYQLDTLITLMKEIIASTSSNELKTFLETTYPKLEPTQDGFADFNETNG
jgi:hypothetical protein